MTRVTTPITYAQARMDACRARRQVRAAEMEADALRSALRAWAVCLWRRHHAGIDHVEVRMTHLDVARQCELALGGLDPLVRIPEAAEDESKNALHALRAYHHRRALRRALRCQRWRTVLARSVSR